MSLIDKINFTIVCSICQEDIKDQREILFRYAVAVQPNAKIVESMMDSIFGSDNDHHWVIYKTWMLREMKTKEEIVRTLNSNIIPCNVCNRFTSWKLK